MGRLGFFTFISRQLTKQPPVLKADLTGKTVLVLGANTGLGFEATKHFATMNPARLILACRSQSRGQAALDKLQADTGYSKAELWLVDLADFDSVKQFADRFESDGGRLDILVENAAIAASTYKPTKDGWEASLQVNDISTPLVAFRLLPALIRTAEKYSTLPRLVVVASEVHFFVEIPKEVYRHADILKTLGSKEYCTDSNMLPRYTLTKLLNVFFVRALNARLPPSTPVIVTMVNPGFCHSELLRDAKGIAGTIMLFMNRILGFTAEEGSRQLVWAAVGGEPDKLRGEYISGCQTEEVADFVLSPQGVKAENQLWDELVDIAGKVDPRVNAIVEQYITATPA
ncbi:hypothetical protein DFH08DRAFT_676159 [Mycena albidolilacea]|uniref:NAD(P)-binding protein n=1 Tax=Mycena albidolilacea TaxID=1033008 RepID=A0AAD7F752_9AGAR|nr:hypothetical protein DFH08DRAFT_676159 [Mycena albidolilacea]